MSDAVTERNGDESAGPLGEDVIDKYLDACIKGEVDEVKEILEGKTNDQMLQLLEATREIEGIGRKRTGLGLALNRHHFEEATEMVAFISKSKCVENTNILCKIFPYTGALKEAEIINNLVLKIVSQEDRVKVLKAKTNWGWTPLMVACTMYDNKDVVKALLDLLRNHGLLKTVVLAEDYCYKLTALDWACNKGHTKVAKELLEACCVPQCTDLLRNLLLRQGRYGMTVLHRACANNEVNSIITSILEVLITRRRRKLLIDLLLQKNYFGDTAFHTCALRGQIKAMQCILQQLDVFKHIIKEWVVLQKVLATRDRNGMTVLHCALHEKQREITDLLFENVDQRTLWEILKDDMSEKRNDMSEISPHRKNLLQFTCYYENASAFHAILERMDGEILAAAIQWEDHSGNTTLHACALQGNVEITKAIIAMCKDNTDTLTLEQLICKQNFNGQTALHVSCYEGHSEVASIILDQLKEFERKNVMRIKDNSWKDILHIACSRGDFILCTELFKHVHNMDRNMASECICMPVTDGRTVGDDDDDDDDPVANQWAERDQDIGIINVMPAGLLHASCRSKDIRILDKVLHSGQQAKCIDRLFAEYNRAGKTAFWETFERGDNRKIQTMLTFARDTNNVETLLNNTTKQNDGFFHYALQSKTCSAKCLDTIINAAKQEKLLPLLFTKRSHMSFINEARDDILKVVMKAHTDGTVFTSYLQKEHDNSRTILDKAALEKKHILMSALLKSYEYLREADSLPDPVEIVKMLCKKDENGKTTLHVACEQNNSKMVETLLELAKQETRLPLVRLLLPIQDASNQSALHLACQEGDLNTVQTLLEYAHGCCVEELLCTQDENGQTALHLACQRDKKKMVKEITKAANNGKCLKDVVLMQDNAKQTFLFHAGKDMVGLLAKELTNFDINKIQEHERERDENRNLVLLIPQLLTLKDRYSKTALHYVPRNQLTWYSAFLDPFYNELLSKSLSKSSTSIDSQSSGLIDNVPPEKYHLFNRDHKGHDLLSVMGEADCLQLVNHKYTKSFLRESWWQLGIYFYCILLFLYVFLLGSLIFFVVKHYEYVLVTRENNTTEVVLQTPLEEGTFISQCILLSVSILILFQEICLMCGRTWKAYWLSIDNVTDFLIGLLCFLVPTCSIFIDYPQRIHELGIATIIATSINFVWMLTKVAVFSLPLLRSLLLHCMMLFHVMRNVCFFFPIYFLFILTFSCAFHIVFQRQEPFSDFGYSIMKTIVMSIGELEFKDMFFPDDESKPLTSYRFSFVLLFAFLIIMTISTMNLLIGMAVDNIRKLEENSEILAYQKLIERIFEGRAVFQTLNRITTQIKKCCTCCKCSKSKTTEGSLEKETEKEPLTSTNSEDQEEVIASTSM